MKINKYSKIIIPFLSILLTLGSCSELDTNLNTINNNDPDEKATISDPDALKSITGGLLKTWFVSSHSYYGPEMAMSTASDHVTCSWGNAGMRDLSSEPRTQFNNHAAYGSSFINEDYFSAMLIVLNDASKVLKAKNNGVNFGDDANMIEAFARLNQGLSVGYMALVYDRVWVSDETGSVTTTEKPFTPLEAQAKSLEYLDKCISIAKSNTFTLPDSWTQGETWDNNRLAQFASSMAARIIVNMARNKAQTASIDWSKVLNYANKGITSNVEFYMDEAPWNNGVWYKQSLIYLTYPGWARVDNYIINLMDNNHPKVWTPGATILPKATSDDKRLATDFGYLSGQDFTPSRGDYHFSNYRYNRYFSYLSGGFKGNFPEMLEAENELYKAEAKMYLGDLSGAASILNSPSFSRKSRGGLADVSSNKSDIEKAIHYERSIELFLTGMTLNWFEMRRNDLLQKGTMLHFPIPESQAELAGIPYYTFGGTQGVAGEDYSNGGWK